MTPVEQQILALKGEKPGASTTRLPSGAHLVTVPEVKLPSGEWNQDVVTVHFVAPPGYPAAKPDCFWVEPGGLRLKGGRTPNGSNDSNPIPEVGPKGTWFSWHLQQWNPNSDSLVTYFNVIMRRLRTLE
jgi:hypothetical protein